MKVASFNGCKVYNLSSGKTMPEWTSKSKKRALAKDEEYQRRVELIQDFEMPTAAQCITMTRDGEHIIVTGTYSPIVKCYTTSDMALKFQRGLTCDVVAMESLSDDFGKLVFLQSDRTLNFHAPYGTHYSVRVPKFGRDMVYNWDNCDLYVCGTGDEVYRLNLEGGQFREPFQLGFEGCNKMHVNPVHPMLACGGEQGHCEFWDPRNRKRINSLMINDLHSENNDITSLKFDQDGITFGVGTAGGFAHIYDIRSRKPLYTKEHQYGLPIVNILYHHTSRKIITCDKKLIKIWDRDNSSAQNMGKIMTNIETTANINQVIIASDNRQLESGLLMVAGEQGRIMNYFIPQLGPAPRWCSFLENLTEELEENTTTSIYEDYKFLTRYELEELGAIGLLGTPMVKSYMHGFFMEMKLYNKLRAVSKPFEFEEYRKQKIREKIDAKRESRIAIVKKAPVLPAVNAELALKLLRKQDAEAKKLENKKGKKKSGISNTEGEEVGAEAEEGEKNATKGLVDDRFRALFEREEFQQDENDEAFRLRNPVRSKMSQLQQLTAKDKDGSDNDDEEGDSDDDMQLYDAVDEDDYDDNDQDNNDNGDDLMHLEEDDEQEDDRYHDEDEEDDEDENRRKKRKHSSSKGGSAGYGEEEEEIGAIAKATLKAKQRQAQRQSAPSSSAAGVNANKKMKMFSLADGVTSSELLFGEKEALQARQKEQRELANMPIEQRIKLLEQEKQVQAEADRDRQNGYKRGGKKGKTFANNNEGYTNTSITYGNNNGSAGRGRGRGRGGSAGRGSGGRGGRGGSGRGGFDRSSGGHSNYRDNNNKNTKIRTFKGNQGEGIVREISFIPRS